jgi:hypothetical protein
MPDLPDKEKRREPGFTAPLVGSLTISVQTLAGNPKGRVSFAVVPAEAGTSKS